MTNPQPTYFLRQISFCFLFLCGINFLNAQQQDDSPILVSNDPSAFIEGFSKSGKTAKGSSPMIIPLSSSRTVELYLNVEKQVNRTLSLIGSVDQEANSSFSLNYANGKVEGHIIMTDENRAYSLYTETNNKVYAKETDINSILCIAFEKADVPSISNKKSSSAKSQ